MSNSRDILSILLQEFNQLKTWTSRKKDLKYQIKKEVDRLKLNKFVASKSRFNLSRFGQTRTVEAIDLVNYLESIPRSQKIQLICLEPEHCVYFWIAVKEV